MTALKYAVPAVSLLMAFSCGQSLARSCDEWLGETVQATGTYFPTEEPYSRPFVFAMRLDCKGVNELITVQRPIGNLPICQEGRQVEVTGQLIWNKALVDGHYEINNPSSVICR